MAVLVTTLDILTCSFNAWRLFNDEKEVTDDLAALFSLREAHC